MSKTTNLKEMQAAAQRQFQVEKVIDYAVENHVSFFGIVRSLLPLIELEKLRSVQRLASGIIRTRENDMIDREVALRLAAMEKKNARDK